MRRSLRVRATRVLAVACACAAMAAAAACNSDYKVAAGESDGAAGGLDGAPDGSGADGAGAGDDGAPHPGIEGGAKVEAGGGETGSDATVSFCGMHAGALFCADFDEIAGPPWGFNDITTVGGGMVAADTRALSLPASVLCSTVAGAAMSSGTLVTSPITATPPVTLSLAFFGPLTGAADTATIAQITFDAMAPLAITLQNGGITFDGITSTGIAAGQWHVVHVTYESAKISWIIEGTSSGGNATIHPGDFTSVQLSVGLISTASLSVDIDNVVLTMP